MSDPYHLQPKQPLSNAQMEKEYFLECARKQARTERQTFWRAPLRSVIRMLRQG